jgi:hypothetical protein
VYLSSLKTLPEYYGRFSVLPQGYAWMYDRFKADTSLFYTTILQNNHKTITLLEKKRKNMPLYSYHGEYTVNFMKTRARQKIAQGFSFEQATSASENEILAFINDYQKNYQFGTLLSKDTFPMFNLKITDFFVLRGPCGSIAAACACWDQREYKQYIPVRYYGWLQILARVPLAQMSGYPKIPSIGKAANYYSAAFLSVKDDNPEIMAIMLGQLSACKSGYDFFALGFHTSHPLSQQINIKKIQYNSRFYLVNYQQDEKNCWLPGKPVLLECALL